MFLLSRPNILVLLGLVIAPMLGCSGKPSRVLAPPIDSTAAAAAALAQYDTNDDGQLSESELASCPALRDGIGRYDENRDRQVSQDELAKRFAMWVESGIGLSSLACRVTWKGQPLVGAEVKLLPEACFADVLQPATGTTDESGIAVLSIDAAHLPSDAQGVQGVQQGLFRVEIRHPEIAIPAKYNTESKLGKEVSFETGENIIAFAL